MHQETCLVFSSMSIRLDHSLDRPWNMSSSRTNTTTRPSTTSGNFWSRDRLKEEQHRQMDHQYQPNHHYPYRFLDQYHLEDVSKCYRQQNPSIQLNHKNHGESSKSCDSFLDDESTIQRDADKLFFPLYEPKTGSSDKNNFTKHQPSNYIEKQPIDYNTESCKHNNDTLQRQLNDNQKEKSIYSTTPFQNTLKNHSNNATCHITRYERQVFKIYENNTDNRLVVRFFNFGQQSFFKLNSNIILSKTQLESMQRVDTILKYDSLSNDKIVLTLQNESEIILENCSCNIFAEFMIELTPLLFSTITNTNAKTEIVLPLIQTRKLKKLKKESIWKCFRKSI